MCVALVPMPSASLTRCPISRSCGVVLHAVDAVRRDELRADPAVPHRLEDVRVVVRDEVQARRPVDRQRVVEALVPLDELLDRDRVGGGRRWASAASSSARLLDPDRVERTGRRARLEDQRVADGVGEVVHLAGARRGRGGRGRHADGPQHLLHRRLVAAQPGRPARGAGDRARLAHVGDRQRVRLDGRLEPVDPHLALRPAHRVGAARARRSPRRRGSSAAASCAAARRARPPDDSPMPIDGRADLGERADEVPLGRREVGRHEHHVHDRQGRACGPAAGRHPGRTFPAVVTAAFVAPYLLPATQRFVLVGRTHPGGAPGGHHVVAGRGPPAGAARGAGGALAGRRRARRPAAGLGGARPVGPARTGGAPHRRARAAPGPARAGARVGRHQGHGRADRPERPRQGTDEGRAARRRHPLRAAPARAHAAGRAALRGRGRLPARRQAACRRRLDRHLPPGRRAGAAGMAGDAAAGRRGADAARGVALRRGAHARQRHAGRPDGVLVDLGLPPAAARGAAHAVDPVDRAAAAPAGRAGVRGDPAGRAGGAAGAGGARRADAPRVVPPPGRLGRGVGGGGPAAGVRASRR